MIELKPPERERNEIIVDDLVPKNSSEFFETVDPRSIRIGNELHELNKTLKEILREMRKRKV